MNELSQKVADLTGRMQRIVRKAVATTRGSADTLGSIAEMFMKRKACSDCNRETHAERVTALNKIFSERERDDQGRVLFKLPLSLLENVINIEYKTQAKMGQTAEMELIGHSAGSVYVRLSAEWDKSSIIKPPVKYFTLKITPSYTELFNISENKPKCCETEFCDHFDVEDECDSIADLVRNTLFHNVECEFFKFTKISRPYSLKVPNTIAAYSLDPDLIDPGVLIFEDFEKTAIYPITTNLSLDALKNIVRALAEIHAACLECSSDWLKWLYPAYAPLTASHFMPAIAALKNSHPVIFGPTLDRISCTITDYMDAYRTTREKHLSDIQPLVLAHGHLVPSNLRWKKNDQDELTDELACIINWQLSTCTVHPGSFAEDLAYLLASSTSPETRRNDLDTLIELYVDHLGQKLSTSPFTVEQIHESFRRVFRCEALRALIPLADCTSQAEKSDTPEIMNVALRAKCLVEDLLLPIYDN